MSARARWARVRACSAARLTWASRATSGAPSRWAVSTTRSRIRFRASPPTTTSAPRSRRRVTSTTTTTARARPSWASSTTDSIFDSHINDGYVSAKSVSIAQVGGQYVLGSVTMGASYSNTQLKADASSSFSTTEKYNSGKAFVAYQATPALIAGVGYAYTAASGDTSAHYHQVSLGADYNLSKRTD